MHIYIFISMFEQHQRHFLQYYALSVYFELLLTIAMCVYVCAYKCVQLCIEEKTRIFYFCCCHSTACSNFSSWCSKNANLYLNIRCHLPKRYFCLLPAKKYNNYDCQAALHAYFWAHHPLVRVYVAF